MKFSVCVEMEACNDDGSENNDMWETVVVEVDDSEENSEEKATDEAISMDFGIRRPNGYVTITAL